jgi:hypothetical protein
MKKKPYHLPTTTALLLVTLMTYPISAGPAMYFATSESSEVAVDTFYGPLFRLPQPLGDLFVEWCNLWIRLR